jgi:rSAM/selenodomain-associated transferase 1
VNAPRGSIVVFAKAPRPGFVKTRMSPPLTPDQAADLYRNLLDDVLAVTAEFSRGLGLDPVVAVHPPEACREMSGRVAPAFRVVAQRGRHLGERMAWAAREAGAAGARRILLRGSDSPVLDGDVVAAVLDRLEDHDLAICPDTDGGYSLIGLRRPSAGLFDHAMSTQSVLEDTLANARRLGLRPHVLPPSFDLDAAEDFLCLAEARARGCANLCPRTLAFLDKNDLWGQ